MDSTEDVTAGVAASASPSSQMESDAAPETNPPSDGGSKPAFDLSHRGSLEEDTQAGAQESSNRSNTSAKSYRRRDHLDDPNEGVSHTLVEEGSHGAFVASEPIVPSRQSMSPDSRAEPRVSLGDATFPVADRTSLPASLDQAVSTDPVPTTKEIYVRMSPEESQRHATTSIRSQKSFQEHHGQGSNDSVAMSSEHVSAEKATASTSSKRSVESKHSEQGSLRSSVVPSQLSGDLNRGSGPISEHSPAPAQSTQQPTHKKKVALLNWIAGPARPRKDPQRSVTPESQTSHRDPAAAPETQDYRASIEELASHFPTFKNVAMVATRHVWSSRIVLYDYIETAHGNSTDRLEPWPLEDTPGPPPFGKFRQTLKGIPDGCTQRLILVEDLTPALIDHLGATFQIPPHVFEEHLERSGYAGVVDDRDDATAWHTRPSAHGYSSITWYRPVLPLVPVTPRFYAKIIGDVALPRVQCPIEGCKKHTLKLQTTANIWRNQLDLCTDPGWYYKTSQTKYPVGWEERATLWTHESHGCKFVIVLLDPLPMVTVKQNDPTNNKRRPRHYSTSANLWIRQHEHAARARYATRTEKEQRHKNVQAWRVATVNSDGASEIIVDGNDTYSEAQPPPHDAGPSSPEADQVRATSIDVQAPSTSLDPVPLRRRFTKPSLARQVLVVHRGIRPGSDQLSDEVEIVNPVDVIHEDFVIHEPIKARASSDIDATYDMHMYIDSLQNPRSTLEEFDHFLMGKGKNRNYDPFQALFRTIHDDSNSLVDIIRTSMRRIREGTLDEDFMQKRVRFWRGLLHRLSFHLSVLEQGLREFEQFLYKPDTQGGRTDTFSQTLSRDTQRTLRGCMDLIDKSSHSLLAEMQIADSRRGIAEAESVSKLTELAFVFIPLSFVASLFSMQIHELDGGVPAYQFALVAIGIVIAAYAVRLSIRSARLIEYRDNFMRQINEDSGLRPDEKLPTRKFIVWAGANIGRTFAKNSKNTAAVLVPLVVALAVIAGVLSPVILLWQRNINAGFSIAITVLILMLDGVLVVPVAVNLSNVGLINFDPRGRIRRIQETHEENRKQRQKERRRRRREAGLDPEAPFEESSVDSGPDLKRKTGSLDSTKASVA